MLASLPTCHLPRAPPDHSTRRLAGGADLGGISSEPGSLPASLAALANQVGVDEEKQDKTKPLLDSAGGGRDESEACVKAEVGRRIVDYVMPRRL